MSLSKFKLRFEKAKEYFSSLGTLLGSVVLLALVSGSGTAILAFLLCKWAQGILVYKIIYAFLPPVLFGFSVVGISKEVVDRIEKLWGLDKFVNLPLLIMIFSLVSSASFFILFFLIGGIEDSSGVKSEGALQIIFASFPMLAAYAFVFHPFVFSTNNQSLNRSKTKISTPTKVKINYQTLPLQSVTNKSEYIGSQVYQSLKKKSVLGTIESIDLENKRCQIKSDSEETQFKSFEDTYVDVPDIITVIEKLKYPQQSIRIGAVQTLGNIGNEEAIDALIAEFHRPESDVKKVIIETLGKLDHEKVTLLMVKLIHDYEYRIPAIKYAGETRLNSVVPDLLDLLQLQDSNLISRQLNEKEILEALGKMGDLRAVKPLIDLLNKPSISYRTKINIINTLGQLGTPSIKDPLKPMLEVQDPYIKIASLHAVGQFGNPDLIKDIVALIVAPNEKVSMAAISATDTFDRVAIVSSLIDLINNDSVRLTRHIRKFIIDSSKSDSRIFDLLLEELRKTKLVSRISWIDIIIEIGNEKANPLLLEILSNHPTKIKSSTIDSIIRINATGTIQALKKAFKNLSPNNKRTKLKLAGAIIPFKDATSIPLLIEVLMLENYPKNEWIIHAIKEIGGYDAVEPLIAILKQKEKKSSYRLTYPQIKSINKTLKRITGKNVRYRGRRYFQFVGKWEKWWEAHK